jgi:hypothetical protein
MTALDPNSSVRESELGMVYSAEGAAGYIASMLNKYLLGEGGLTPENFKNIVNTSIQLAASAQSSTLNQVNYYLDTLPGLPPDKRNLFTKRVPQNFINYKPTKPSKVINTFVTEDGVIIKEVE